MDNPCRIDERYNIKKSLLNGHAECFLCRTGDFIHPNNNCPYQKMTFNFDSDAVKEMYKIEYNHRDIVIIYVNIHNNWECEIKGHISYNNIFTVVGIPSRNLEQLLHDTNFDTVKIYLDRFSIFKAIKYTTIPSTYKGSMLKNWRFINRLLIKLGKIEVNHLDKLSDSYLNLLRYIRIDGCKIYSERLTDTLGGKTAKDTLFY